MSTSIIRLCDREKAVRHGPSVVIVAAGQAPLSTGTWWVSFASAAPPLQTQAWGGHPGDMALLGDIDGDNRDGGSG